MVIINVAFPLLFLVHLITRFATANHLVERIRERERIVERIRKEEPERRLGRLSSRKEETKNKRKRHNEESKRKVGGDMGTLARYR